MLRAMFAGIGQVLRTTDKLRGKSEPGPVDPEKVVSDTSAAAPAAQTAPETAAAPAVPETAASEPAAAQEVAADVAAASSAAAEAAAPAPAAAEAKPKTAAKPRAAAKPQAAAKPAGGHVRLLAADEVPAAQAEAAPEPAAAVAPASGAELPLANYDELSVASLRARLRNLSADQLGQLIAYEKDHAAREDVITMFERRIAKLAEG
jgi:hypothetical protein